MAVLWITAADLADPDDPLAPLAAENASWVLYNLSGQKYPGVKEVTEWYGRRGSSCFSCNYGESYQADTGYVFVPHGHRYFSDTAPGLRLRGRPIVSVSSVATAAGVLPSADYQVANRSVLYRTNKSAWDFLSGVTVTYRWGQYPPSMGKSAAILLANQFLMAMNDDDECALPATVTSVTRLGVSFGVKDPAVLAAMRLTGIPAVDLFLKTANPGGSVKRPKIFSPDIPRGEKYL